MPTTASTTETASFFATGTSLIPIGSRRPDGLSNTFAVGEAVAGWCAWNNWRWSNGCTATSPFPELPQGNEGPVHDVVGLVQHVLILQPASRAAAISARAMAAFITLATRSTLMSIAAWPRSPPEKRSRRRTEATSESSNLDPKSACQGAGGDSSYNLFGVTFPNRRQLIDCGNLDGSVRSRAEEAVLLRQAAGGSREAFALLVRLHQAAVRWCLVRYVRDPATADDLAQEVFLAAYQNLATCRSAGSLRGWLLGIARNVAIQHVRSESRRRLRERGRWQRNWPNGGSSNWSKTRRTAWTMSGNWRRCDIASSIWRRKAGGWWRNTIFIARRWNRSPSDRAGAPGPCG